MPVVLSAVTEQPLDLAAHQEAVDRPGAGAVVHFVGQVRDHDPGADGEVVSLDYSFHPDAPAVLEALAQRLLDALDPRHEVHLAVSHRVGHLEVGDLALVACVSAPHRRAAFLVCDAVVEAVKAELPIWKKQFEADGRHTWSGIA